MIGGLSIGAEDDEVFDVVVIEGNRAVNQIRERRAPRGNLEADRARHTSRLIGGNSFRRQRAAGPVVDPAASGSFCGLPLLLQCLNRAVAVVRSLLFDELRRPGAIDLDSLRLKV